MVKLNQNMSSPNDGEQHKDNNENNNIVKYRESNKDPLSVPLVARDMRKSGEFSINDIEKVTFYNAYEYYKQSDRFKWKP